MATTTENRPRTVTGAESEFDHAPRPISRPDIRVNQTNQSSGSIITYLITALVIAIGGYYYYTSYYTPTVSTPAATQTTPPAATAPAIDAPVVTPPAVTPPAVTPPAVTPPATTTP